MISVIIPTLNRAALLRKTLTSLVAQEFKGDFEVLVIDNGSTDNTKEVVSAFQDTLKDLTYLHESSPGLHEGRNRGLRESKYEILAFIDDDIEAFPEWLDGVHESFQDEKTGLVGGNNLPLYEAEPPQWLKGLWITNDDGSFLSHLSLLNFGDQPKEIHPHFVFGCNYCIRKSLLIKAGGFHPDGMPPEFIKYRGDGETYVAEQVQALGYKTLFNPRVSIYHVVPASRMTIDYLKKRAFSEGISQSYIDTRYNRKRSTSFLATFRRFVKQRLNLVSPLEKAAQESFDEGYFFHQRELKKDKKLMDWVMKENYL